VRYLSGLDDQSAHVVELHLYSSLDELSSLAHKVEHNRKAKGRELYPSLPHLGLTPSKDPQTQLLDHKLRHLHGQLPSMLKIHLKETLPNRKKEGDVFGVKDLGTLLPSAQTRELLLWPNFKHPLGALMERMKKGKSNTQVDGDHHEQAPSTRPASPHIHSSPKEVKNIHALVKETAEQ